MKIYKGQIPFTHARTKKQLDYCPAHQTHYYGNDIFWHDNLQFFARLSFYTFARGRSSAVFVGVLSDVECTNGIMQTLLDGCEVNIFMVDMTHILQNISIHGGKTNTGLWSFCKRGMSYGIRLDSPA